MIDKQRVAVSSVLSEMLGTAVGNRGVRLLT